MSFGFRLETKFAVSCSFNGERQTLFIFFLIFIPDLRRQPMSGDCFIDPCFVLNRISADICIKFIYYC